MRQSCYHLLLTVVLLPLLLVSGTALALPDGWRMEMTETQAWTYDETGRLRYHAWVDDGGVFHEETYGRSAGGSSGGVFTEGTPLGSHTLQVVVAEPVAQLVVYEPFSGEVFYQQGGLAPGQAVELPTDHLSDRVQLLVAQDAAGRALELLFFKRANVCSSSSWLSL